MKRHLTVGAAIAAGALAALPATAPAATQTVFAQDSGGQLAWSPNTLAAQTGDTVEWSLAQATGAHDLWLVPPGVDVHDTAKQEQYAVKFPGEAPYSRTFDTAGEWFYYCSLHGGREPGGMNGVLAVAGPGGDPGTDPGGSGTPNRPSVVVQPEALNDWTSPLRLEEGDNSAPRLSNVRASRAGRSTRVRFTVSEPGSVTIRFLLKGRTVRTARVSGVKAGAGSVRIRDAKGLKGGKYVIRVRAADAAANESQLKKLRLTIRR